MARQPGRKRDVPSFPVSAVDRLGSPLSQQCLYQAQVKSQRQTGWPVCWQREPQHTHPCAGLSGSCQQRTWDSDGLGPGGTSPCLGEVSVWSAVPQGSRQGPSSTSLPELPLGAEPAKPAMCCWDLLWSALPRAPTSTLCSSSLPDRSGARAVSMPAQSRGTQAWRGWLTAVRVCLGQVHIGPQGA